MFSRIDQDWLVWCLNSSIIQNQIHDATTQVGQPKLAIKRIEELLIPLPPHAERCRELIDAADEMTRRLYCVVDWLALHPEYNPKTKVIPKKDYPVLVDVTF